MPPLVSHWLDGIDAAALEQRLAVPSVHLFESIGSTMDEAHRLAGEGAPAGTVVIAGEQTSGRGRGGKRWTSAPGLGLWFTVLERPDSPSGLDVLSLRLGLHVAPVLDGFANGPVSIKWPNDLYVGEQKLAGILVEARWRDARPDWVAIGIGVNLTPPSDMPDATGLGSRVSRTELLAALVPAVRRAADSRGVLTHGELSGFANRDYLRGRQLREPAGGVALGIAEDGSLIIQGATGASHFRGGSIVFEKERT